jgi:YVTN family beta-propeller protein
VERRQLLIALAAAGCSRKERPGFAGFAFVANHEGKAIAAVDLTAFAVVRHIALGEAPGQLISLGARRAVYALTPENGTVHEVSAPKLERTRWTAVCRKALRMYAAGADTLWVMARDPQELIEVRLDAMNAARRIALPYPANDFDLTTEDPPRAVVSFGETGKVGLVDLATGKMQLTAAAAPVEWIRFRKDGRQWIAAHREKRQLTIALAATGKVVVRLPLAMQPEHVCVKADGGQMFITGAGADAVAILFPYSTEIAETVLAGRQPGEMACSPRAGIAEEFLFVTNPSSNQVTILNVNSRKVVAVAQVGAQPGQVLITPDNAYALVLNRESGDMAVLMIQDAARRRKYPAALFTMIPVGSRPVDVVVQAV